MGMGFMYGTGIGGLESSQAKTMVYWTFAALGGNRYAQMALVSRWIF